MNWRWRTLTERSGYRVVFLPDSRTLSADMIAGVRLLQPVPPHEGIHEGFPLRVVIDIYRADERGKRCAEHWGTWMGDEPEAVFAMLTEAHVRARTAGGAS